MLVGHRWGGLEATKVEILADQGENHGVLIRLVDCRRQWLTNAPLGGACDPKTAECRKAECGGPAP